MLASVIIDPDVCLNPSNMSDTFQVQYCVTVSLLQKLHTLMSTSPLIILHFPSFSHLSLSHSLFPSLSLSPTSCLLLSVSQAVWCRLADIECDGDYWSDPSIKRFQNLAEKKLVTVVIQSECVFSYVQELLRLTLCVMLVISHTFNHCTGLALDLLFIF